MSEPTLFRDHSEAVSFLRKEIQEACIRGDFIRAVDFTADVDFSSGATIWRVYVRCGTKL